MGFDVVDYIKKKKQQEDNKKENETEKTGQNRFDVAEYSKYKNAENVANSINERLQTWFKNNGVFMQNHTDRYQGRTGIYNDGYVSDASKWLETITNQKNNFDLEAKSIISLMDEYSDFLDADYVKKAKEYLTTAQGYQNDILKASSADVDYWSQWKDESAYKEWVDVQKQNEEWAAVNIEGERSWYNRDMQNLAQAKEWQDKLDYDRELRMYYPNDYHNLPNTLSDADIRNANAQIMRLTLGKGIDEFEKYLSEKNVYLTQAERYQNSVKLSSVVDAPDFEYYAQKGIQQEAEYHKLGSTFSKEGNKIVAYKNHGFTYAASHFAGGGGGNPDVYLATEMTDDEVKIYSYYYAKEGEKKADEYFNSIRETLEARQAGKIVASAGDDTASKIIFGAVAGLDNFRAGIENLFSNEDYYVPSAIQIAGQQFREDLSESGAKLPDWLGGASLGQTTYDLLNTGANMAPSILASIGANLLLPGSGAVVGGTLMGASAGGNAYAEMINAGYSKEQAKTYGMLVAASESLLQYALGGVSALGGKLTGGAMTKMLSKVDNAFARVILTSVGKMASEGLEEGLQTVLEPWFKSVATKTDFEAADIDEVLYSGLLGALSAGILENVNVNSSDTAAGATANAINKYSSNVAVGKQISGVDGAVNRLLELGSVVSADSVAPKIAQKINKRLADGKKVGAYTIAKLFNAEKAALTETNVADITKSLTRKGVTESDAKTISAWMAKVVEGVPLTEAQANALENNPLLDRTFQDVIINPNSTVYQRTKQMSDFVSDVRRGEMTQNKATTATPATDTSKTVIPTESATTQENATESKFKASVDGKTVLTETAEEVKPVGIESIKNGSVKVKLEDGKVVDASEISFATKDEAVLYETISNITDITPKSATYLIKNFEPVEGVPTEVLASDLALAYQYGKINYADGLENLDSSKSQMKAAFYIGRNEAEAALGEKSSENAETVLKTDKKSGIINKNELEIENENREGIYLRDGSERFGSTSTRGQIRGVEESTGQEESRGIESRFTADSEAARLVDEAREIKVSSLGIPRGSSNHTVKLVDKANETSSMKEARKLAEERGLKATFFVGDNLTINGKDGSPVSVRAYIRGKNVFVRADHYAYTSEQLMRHEIGHDMVAKGEVDIDAVRQRLVQTAGEENIDEVSTLYTNAYDGTGMTAEEIWEECICDSLGDMNIFAEVEMLGEFLDEMLPEIKGATQSSESPTQTRGSPEGKTSRETSRKKKYGKTVKYLSASKVGAANMDYIKRQLTNLYSGLSDGIADGIAVENGNLVYIVDSGRENGKIDFGVRLKKAINNESLRADYIKERNDYAISNGQVSDGLSQRLGSGLGYHSDSNLRREFGTELQADKGKSEDKQGGVFRENADKRGLSDGKASRETRTYSKEDYNNFGWVRQNNVINAGYWKAFTENFAQAVSGNQYFPKTKNGEYMIEVYDMYDLSDVADVIVFAKGTIESPNVTKIIKIDLTQDIDIEAKRSELYAAERKGIRRSFGQVFIHYNKSDFLSERKHEGNSFEGDGNNNRLNTKRSRSEIKANPITQFHVNEDENTVTYTYANGETITESLSKTSRELDFIEYANEMSDVKQARLAGRMAQGRIDAEVIRKKDEQIKSIREQRDVKLKELQQKYAESRKNAVEGRRKTEMKHKIKNFKDRLERTLQNPTDNMYVPIGLVGAMVDVCELIDTDTDLYKKDGSINKAQQRRNITKEKLRDLKDEYEKLKKHPDPTYSGEFDETIYDYLDDLQRDFGDKNLNDMTLDELQEMYETLRGIEETLRDARKLIGWTEAYDAIEAASIIRSEQEAIAKKHKNEKRSKADLIRDFSLNKTLSPIRNVERMSGYNQDSPLFKAFKKFAEGQRKKNRFEMDSYKLFEPLTTGENANKYEDSIYKEYSGYKYVDKNGRTFGVSKMQMMQAILSYERETADDLNHIQSLGFSFADIGLLNKGKLREAVSSEHLHRVMLGTDMVSDFKKVLENDKWAQKYMNAARKFFNEMAKDVVDDYTIATKHRIITKSKNYIPFEVDKSYIAREITDMNSISQTISSYGNLKALQKKADQPIIITGLNNVVERHIDQVGNIYGFGVEVRNFNKIWSIRASDALGDNATIRSALEKSWGVAGVDHIEQAVKDIQGKRKSNQSATYRWIKSKYIGATFFLNLSVVFKQIGSMFAATSMLRYRSPARMIANLFYTMANYKKISAEVDKYTATAWVRRRGFSDSELQTLLTEGKKSWFGRFGQKLPALFRPSKWIQGMDSAVALSLWKYAKQDTAKRTGLKGEDLLKATAKFYDEVVESTQSMTDVLHRPEIQKSGDVFSEALGTFKTDLYQMSGQLCVTLGRYMANKSGENAKALVRTASSVVMSAVWTQLMTTLFALLRYKVNSYRDDDDDDLTAESWLKRQSLSFAADITGYLFPLLGSELVGIIESSVYGESAEAVDNIVLTAINDFVDVVTGIASNMKDGEMPTVDDARKLLVKSLQMFGLPANNISRIVEAVRLHAKDIQNGEFLSFEAGVERSSTKHFNRVLEEFASGNTDVALELYEEAVEELALRKAKDGEVGEDEVDEAISSLKTALGKKYKDGELDYDTAYKMLSTLFNMSEYDIYWKFDEWNYAAENGSADGYSKYDDVIASVESGNPKDTIEELVKIEADGRYEKAKAEAEKEGKRFDERKEREEAEKSARSTIKSAITKHWKKLAVEAFKSNDKTELLRIRDLLFDTGLYGRSRSEVYRTMMEWRDED